jgi:hypothetical protein
MACGSPQRPTALAAIRARSAGSSRTIVPSGRVAETNPLQALRSRSSLALIKAARGEGVLAISIRSAIVTLDDPFHRRSSVPSSAQDDYPSRRTTGRLKPGRARTCPRARVTPVRGGLWVGRATPGRGDREARRRSRGSQIFAPQYSRPTDADLWKALGEPLTLRSEWT